MEKLTTGRSTVPTGSRSPDSSTATATRRRFYFAGSVTTNRSSTGSKRTTSYWRLSTATRNGLAGNSLNLVREARTGTLLQKRDDPSALTAQRALDMLTCEAARVLGMADEIGSLAVGKCADITLLDATDPTLRPHFGDEGLLSNLVYSFHGRAESVLVEGKVVVADGEVVADVEPAMATAREFAESVEMG